MRPTRTVLYRGVLPDQDIRARPSRCVSVRTHPSAPYLLRLCGTPPMAQERPASPAPHTSTAVECHAVGPLPCGDWSSAGSRRQPRLFQRGPVWLMTSHTESGHINAALTC